MIQLGKPHGYGQFYAEDKLLVGKTEHGVKEGEFFVFISEGGYYKGILDEKLIKQG